MYNIILISTCTVHATEQSISVSGIRKYHWRDVHHASPPGGLGLQTSRITSLAPARSINMVGRESWPTLLTSGNIYIYIYIKQKIWRWMYADRYMQPGEEVSWFCWTGPLWSRAKEWDTPGHLHRRGQTRNNIPRATMRDPRIISRPHYTIINHVPFPRTLLHIFFLSSWSRGPTVPTAGGKLYYNVM